MNDIYSGIANGILFFAMLLKVGVYTGLIVVPFVVLGYELSTKRRPK